GKGALAGRLIEEVRRRGPSVAVLACDPESPLTGGALLGDRFRMPAHPDDDGVFIRSLAAAGGGGALAAHLDALVRVVEGFGFEVVLLETVGAGQGGTAGGGPAGGAGGVGPAGTGGRPPRGKGGGPRGGGGGGRRGWAEGVPHHRAAVPGAGGAGPQVLAWRPRRGARAPPVLRVSGRTGAGVAELWDRIAALPLRRGKGDAERELLRLA